MPTTVLQEAPSQELLTLTVEQYHRMLETGILTDGEPIELLDGLLVVKDRGRSMTLSPLHALLVSRLMKLAAEIEALGAHLRLQSPVTIAPSNEPEPDGFVVAGSVEDYADRHPGPGDVSCAIEVSESSLKRDQTTKQRIYATAEIPQYVICNRVDRQVEVHEDPSPEDRCYGTVRVLGKGDELVLLVPGGQQLKVSAALLLP